MRTNPRHITNIISRQHCLLPIDRIYFVLHNQLKAISYFTLISVNGLFISSSLLNYTRFEVFALSSEISLHWRSSNWIEIYKLNVKRHYKTAQHITQNCTWLTDVHRLINSFERPPLKWNPEDEANTLKRVEFKNEGNKKKPLTEIEVK